jgi:hypothetical protein
LKFKPLSNRLKQFMQSNRYYNIFIPAMCRLSPHFAKYQEQLLRVNNKGEFFRDVKRMYGLSKHENLL